MRFGTLFALVALLWAGSFASRGSAGDVVHAQGAGSLDAELAAALASAGFTGTVESTLEERLGRPLNLALADLGRLLFFDSVLGLHEDNSCAGCHTPAFGFGDSQSIAIGVQNNGVVGPGRRGPRNQRKAPPIVNAAFFPRQMLNGRFVALSGDPFDNSAGFGFPPPERDAFRFPAGDPRFRTLLSAQGHIPPTELVEMAGFSGATANPLIHARFHQFDDGRGTPLPLDADGDGFLNEEIRDLVLQKLNAIEDYVVRFADSVNGGSTAGFAIDFAMVGAALAEFQLSQTLANAPIDRFARGERGAMTARQKRGALLFFGTARCVDCHAVTGPSNEMFSDFQNRVLGVPQIAPFFGAGTGNVVFDGPGSDEDFGAEQISGDPPDRYKFRTSPLRNVGQQPAFFHNGAFTRLQDAIAHHLDVERSARNYNPHVAGIDRDLTHRRGPIEPVLARLDPLVEGPLDLTPRELSELVAFVGEGLLDPRATRENLCGLVPAFVPSGLPVAVFQGCAVGQ
jgi:cytochrome c peroxidase